MDRKIKNICGGLVAKHRRGMKPRLTQLELARRVSRAGAKLDRAAIAKIENGLRGVLDYELVALAKALRLPIRKLVGMRK